jgi:hypothetical protein
MSEPLEDTALDEDDVDENDDDDAFDRAPQPGNTPDPEGRPRRADEVAPNVTDPD